MGVGPWRLGGGWGCQPLKGRLRIPGSLSTAPLPCVCVSTVSDEDRSTQGGTSLPPPTPPTDARPLWSRGDAPVSLRGHRRNDSMMSGQSRDEDTGGSEDESEDGTASVGGQEDWRQVRVRIRVCASASACVCACVRMCARVCVYVRVCLHACWVCVCGAKRGQGQGCHREAHDMNKRRGGRCFAGLSLQSHECSCTYI